MALGTAVFLLVKRVTTATPRRVLDVEVGTGNCCMLMIAGDATTAVAVGCRVVLVGRVVDVLRAVDVVLDVDVLRDVDVGVDMGVDVALAEVDEDVVLVRLVLVRLVLVDPPPVIVVALIGGFTTGVVVMGLAALNVTEKSISSPGWDSIVIVMPVSIMDPNWYELVLGTVVGDNVSSNRYKSPASPRELRLSSPN